MSDVTTRIVSPDLDMARLRALEAAAKKFIDKVESGRAQSRETYAELKAALAIGSAE